MDINKVKRKPKVEQKVAINIKVSKAVSDWMKEKNVSPTRVFNNAIEELMSKNK